MHVITGTGVGGAEMMLFKLLSAMDRNRFSNIVYSLIEPGPTADRIRGLGIEVHTLGMKQGLPDPRAILRLARAVGKWKPDVIQTWMYHGDLLGGLVGRLICGIPVVWNVRHSDFHPEGTPWLSYRVAELCAALSARVPEAIVFCAHSSLTIHRGLGYRGRKMIVIPNGFDLAAYRPQSGAGALCEERFGIPRNARLVSLIARYHPQKDHATFLAAAKICAARFPETVFALCGDGITDANEELTRAIENAGLRGRTLLLGRRPAAEIALLMSRSSLVTSSSSWGEAFPNVLGEAMACGAVCVATDVGDSAYIVGDTGFIVPLRSPGELAQAWMQVLEMDEETRLSLGEAARTRVEANFSLPVIASRYENLYLGILGEEAA